MNSVEKGQRVLDLEIGALQAMRERMGEEFVRAVGILREVLEAGKKIVVTGVGKSGHVGGKIAATLTSTGAPAVALDAVNAAHGDMGILVPGDALLILSYSGETEEIVRLLPNFKRPDVKIIALTGNAKSPIAREADVHLDVFVEREACPLNLAPTASTTAMVAMGDALAMTLLEERGFQKEDFAVNHPGGTIGRNLLLKVDRIMRPLEKVAVCAAKDTVRDAISRMSEKRCGAVIITKPDGTLAGIFTHGDFARAFQKSADVGSKTLDSLMTPNPICVQVDNLAVQVLNTFSKHQIQDLIVLDALRRPVGLVDVQDLTKMELM